MLLYNNNVAYLERESNSLGREWVQSSNHRSSQGLDFLSLLGLRSGEGEGPSATSRMEKISFGILCDNNYGTTLLVNWGLPQTSWNLVSS